LPINFSKNIISISTSFKNNIPFGETNILYKNGTKISLLLNEYGFYCGAQNYFNEYNELIKIKQITFDGNLEWVKKHDFYFILHKNSGLANILSTLGNQPGEGGKMFKNLSQNGHYVQTDWKRVLKRKKKNNSFRHINSFIQFFCTNSFKKSTRYPTSN